MIFAVIIVGLLIGVGVSFLYPWDGDRKPKPRKFAGAGVAWSVRPEQRIEKASWDEN